MLFLCVETNGHELIAIRFVYSVSYLQVKCKIVCRCVEVNLKKSMRKIRGITWLKLLTSLCEGLSVLSYRALNEASRDVGGRGTVVLLNTGPSHRIYTNDPCYITYLTLKQVL
jgi:hypothetical protein